MYRIIEITNEHSGFYALMGPYLSKRSIVKELGYPVWDDGDKVWFVAVREKKDTPRISLDDVADDMQRAALMAYSASLAWAEVLGFVAYTEKADTVTFTSDYTMPRVRGQEVCRALFAARLKAVEGKRVVSVVTKDSVGVFRESGFKVKGRRGRYYRVERIGDVND